MAHPFMESQPSLYPEREAFIKLDPDTFFVRHPPPPHELEDFITDDDDLFHTIHMGAAVVDYSKYRLVIDGLVSRPYSLTLERLKKLPSTTVTAFHECYGSPLKPPTEALRRIGNVQWTGVPLNTLLSKAEVLDEGRFVWSEGLDRGVFAGVAADRYQKDLPLSKALSDEVLVAYAVNGLPLSKNRGGPVRLVVPGWFGTNSTKWLCRIEVRERRAPGPFTTTFYNEHYPPDDPECPSKPIWKVQPNSMITKPHPGTAVRGPDIEVFGWAWGEDGVASVMLSADEGRAWIAAEVDSRTGFSWQRFRGSLTLSPGEWVILVRAEGADGRRQPLGIGRNHVHRVSFQVE